MDWPCAWNIDKPDCARTKPSAASQSKQPGMTDKRSQFNLKRVAAALTVIFLLGVAAWVSWEPGKAITDGRHDRGHNGIWLQHGWLGDDEWFHRNGKTDQIPRFREPQNIAALAALLRTNGITDVFPHLCPCSIDGEIAGSDPAQVERFLDGLEGFRVMPWIGGVLGVQARLHKPEWRIAFVASVTNLLNAHPRLAGVQINIEPMPSGNPDFLKLLDELQAALPEGKLLSVAAYPPPTRWQPVPEVHWDETYFREIARRCDQLAVMMYDTSIRHAKPYRQLMSSWTREVLDWSGNTPVLLGVPAYADADSGYHDPAVENVLNALRGIHGGLSAFPSVSVNFQGAALYSDWEMDATEWATWQREFLRPAQ